MKKVIAVAFLCFLGLNQVNAQVTFKPGLRAGANFAHFTQIEDPNQKFSSLTDVYLGVFGAFAPTSLDAKSHKLTSLNFVTNMDYKRFTFGYSYDYNLSSLIDTKGIFEISVSYQFDSIFGDNSSIPCGCK